MSRHRVWSTDDTVERMEACRQKMIGDGDEATAKFDTLEAECMRLDADIDKLEKLLLQVTA